MKSYDMCLWALRQWAHNYRGEAIGVTTSHVALMWKRSRASIHGQMRKLEREGKALYWGGRWYPSALLSGVNSAAMFQPDQQQSKAS